nr:hypothetical protein BaRGS_005735 [Batillaria attramentaria]
MLTRTSCETFKRCAARQNRGRSQEPVPAKADGQIANVTIVHYTEGAIRPGHLRLAVCLTEENRSLLNWTLTSPLPFQDHPLDFPSLLSRTPSPSLQTHLLEKEDVAQVLGGILSQGKDPE